jgi:hypothetical protein
MEDNIHNEVKWQAPEYIHKTRTTDWYWTIGLIALGACIAALWMGNYLFAIFILIGGASLILFTIREPQQFSFTIESEGLRIEREMYLWKSLTGFTIKEKKGELYSRLIVQTSKYFLPVYTILIPHNLIPEVREELVKHIPQVELEESRSMQFMEKLGF